LAGIINAPAGRSSFNYIRGGPWGKPPRPSGLFLTKPPYGRITAIDLNKGEILWQVPHGEGPRDHPLLKDLNLPRLGSPSNAMTSNSGPVITKTLVMYSHVEVLPDASWSKDKRWLIAYDKQTGDVLWQEKLAEPPYGVPMTYMHEGKQYIAVGVGGAAEPGGILAYALP
jgi:quinoprotein glucose dehydrogenase